MSHIHVMPQQLRQQAQHRAWDILNSVQLPSGTALAATGSFARGELGPHSDLDLILLVDAQATALDSAEIERVWYPIWDAKMRLDYAVRTPEECAQMMTADSTAALALLDLSHCRGQEKLTERARELVLATWRKELKKNFNNLVDTAIARWRRSGSLVTMTRPDLKHGHGGLRDIDLINALALANLSNRAQLDQQRTLLLDTRTLLHFHMGRARDVLDPEFAVDVATDLGFADRYELARALAAAAKTVDDALTEALATARNLLPSRTKIRRPIRRPLDVDVVELNGEITLSRTPDLSDPGLLLRVAAAGARTGLSVAPHTWKRLTQLPPLPEIMPTNMAGDFFALLSSPEHSARVIHQMDEYGLWEKIVPEWKNIRGLVPREPTHIHTVDQHSLMVVHNCAQRSVNVARPDLLYLAALFHDIGKGQQLPHEQVGAEYVAHMAKRLRLNKQEIHIVKTVVAQHTLIPQILRRMDPTGSQALEQLLDATGYDRLIINLLETLVEADSLATGPGVFSPSLSAGLKTLCHRAKVQLSALAPQPPQVHAPDTVGVRHEENNMRATIYWRGSYDRESIRIFALVAAKEWNILGAGITTRVDKDSGQRIVEAELEVYNTLGTGFDEQDIVQSYKSGVFSALPTIHGGLTTTMWQDDILEVRTTDRQAALGTLLGVLPGIKWLRMTTPGATMIVQCQLEPGFDRAQVERDVTRLLTSGNKK
ncbi:[protein-PII] uridylyltransferase [Corynebacterium sp. sy039]|uniref:[protein-PII] uridylyltransferase n=1 Tax=Corynebacterium sp. sy039 TaxID=2599641 RepID=UPI0011B7D313|nr:[protein-PII] uridylyltransferase [Corynebacterium sp. sy039]QDZ42842.1 [protein-PII] uridylyltransferase [Corynebacterium sp. sy039]